MILEQFGAKVQTGESNSKTYIKIKSCFTNLLQLTSLLRHRKVFSVHKCLRSTFDMRHDLRFHLLSRNITSYLIDFMFFRR